MRAINPIYCTVKKEKRKTNRCVTACARLLYVLWLLSYKEYNLGAKWCIHNNNKHSKYCKRSQKIKQCKKYSSSMSCFYHDCFAKLFLKVKCIHKLTLCAVCSFSLLLFSFSLLLFYFIFVFLYMNICICVVFSVLFSCSQSLIRVCVFVLCRFRLFSLICSSINLILKYNIHLFINVSLACDHLKKWKKNSI